MPDKRKTYPALPKAPKKSSTPTEVKSILKKGGKSSSKKDVKSSPKKDTKSTSKNDTRSTSKKQEKQVFKRPSDTAAPSYKDISKSGDDEYYEKRVKLEVFGNIVRRTTLIITRGTR